MALLDFIGDKLKVLHKVKRVPDENAKEGFHFVSREDKKGALYVKSADEVHKIIDSADFYEKEIVDEKLGKKFNTSEVPALMADVVKLQGYFGSLAELQAAYPSPQKGWQAYVSSPTSSTGYYVATVNSGGNWVVGTVEAPGIDVDFTEYTKNGGSGKTLKEVDDNLTSEIVQLAGETVIRASPFKIGHIPQEYASALNAILEIEVYDNDFIGYNYRVNSLYSSGFVKVSKVDSITGTIVGSTIEAVGQTAISDVQGVVEWYAYSITSDFWIRFKVDINNVQQFITSITETGLYVEKKYIHPIAGQYFTFFENFPLSNRHDSARVIKYIQVKSNMLMQLRLQSITSSNIVFYDILDSNKSYSINKSELKITASGYYAGSKTIGEATIDVIIDFDSINSANQLTMSAQTYLYLKKNCYTINSYDAADSVYVPEFARTTSTERYFSIKSLKIHTSDRTVRFTVQAVRKSGQVLVLYVRDLQGNNIVGASLQIFDTDRIYLSESIWFYDGYAKSRYRIQVVVDDALITEFGHTANIGQYINYSNYAGEPIEFSKTKQYCNLGASTSGGYWHQDAVKHNNMNWRSYNVGSCMWIVKEGATLNTDTYPSDSLDNNIFNQIAKLNLANTNEDYYPDAIGIMCGLSESQNGAWVLGTYEDAMSADLTGFTAENWISDAPENYKNNMSICIRAALTFLASKYLYSQIITFTVQQVASPSYHIDKVLIINNLIMKISKRLAIQTIDLGGECGIDGIAGTTGEFISPIDFVHYTTAGDRVAYNYVRKKLKQVLFFKKAAI